MAGKMSAETLRALDLVKQGLTPYAAAKVTGIALSTIYRALGREAPKPLTAKEEKDVIAGLEARRDAYLASGQKIRARAITAYIFELQNPDFKDLKWSEISADGKTVLRTKKRRAP